MTEIPLLRNSERSDFKECQQKWEWRWNQGLVFKMPKQDARWFGSMWHLVWAAVYTPPGRNGFVRGITSPSEIHALWDELAKGQYAVISVGDYFDELAEKKFMDAQTLGHIMIDGQLAQYNLDPGWEVLMPEMRYAANIPYNTRQRASERFGLDHLSLGQFITRMVGTFDLPIRDHTDNGEVKVVDWKTTNKKENVRFLEKDDQLGTYVSVSTGYLRARGLIKANESVTGGVWSYAKKGTPPDPSTTDAQGRVRNKPQKKHYIDQIMSYCNKNSETVPIGKPLEKCTLPELQDISSHFCDLTILGDVSKVQPGPLFWRVMVERGKKNRLRQIERIADDAEAIAAVRAGIMPVTKNPGEHCNWCDFSDLCDLDENGDETEQFIKDVYRVEDVYADHRAGAKNSKEIR